MAKQRQAAGAGRGTAWGKAFDEGVIVLGREDGGYTNVGYTGKTSHGWRV